MMAECLEYVVIYRNVETKRYDFEAKSVDEAAEIVSEIKKGISPYHNNNV